MNSFYKKILGLRTDFQLLFFQNEYQALSGRNKQTILMLTFILWLTFMAIGFALASLSNLQKRMDDPFTNWVNLPIAKVMSKEKAVKIKETYSKPPRPFLIKEVSGYISLSLNFLGEPAIELDNPFPDHKVYSISGRAITKNQPILPKILDDETGNLLWSAENFDPANPQNIQSCDLIVTQSFLKNLGYETGEIVKTLAIQTTLGENAYISFLNIAAIVKELPTKSSFFCTHKLYNLLQSMANLYCDEYINYSKKGDNNFDVFSPQVLPNERVDSLVNIFFPNVQLSLDQNETLKIHQRKYWAYHLSFSPLSLPTFDSIYQFFAFIESQLPLLNYAVIDCSSTDCEEASEDEFDRYAFQFEQLDSVRAFRQNLLDTFKIELDISLVKAKENFVLVSRLTFTLAIMLFSFGILSIVLFINNLLRTHLIEIRPNLGTFQAFGLSNSFLIQNYLKIIASFLGVAILAALSIAGLIVIVEKLLFDGQHFDIFNRWIVVAAIGLSLFSLVLSLQTIRNILNDTPGNLIYKR